MKRLQASALAMTEGHAFISYSWEDGASCRLGGWLVRNGVGTWMDRCTNAPTRWVIPERSP